jgi:hypothetical protein
MYIRVTLMCPGRGRNHEGDCASYIILVQTSRPSRGSKNANVVHVQIRDLAKLRPPADLSILYSETPAQTPDANVSRSSQ